ADSTAPADANAAQAAEAPPARRRWPGARSKCWPARTWPNWALAAVAAMIFALGQGNVDDATVFTWRLRPPTWFPLPTNGVVLLDNINSAYLVKGQAVSLFAPQARDILTAKTVPELNAAMDRLGITAVLSYRSYRMTYFQDGPLGEYLDDPDNFRYDPINIVRMPASPFTFYARK
ncbi:MAG: hypothetical protein LBD90_01190, partial [Bifidobacteriaceae bacterium]|nr:hypothetical protein [Bifidobacteriaceae bacterium]